VRAEPALPGADGDDLELEHGYTVLAKSVEMRMRGVWPDESYVASRMAPSHSPCRAGRMANLNVKTS
jgi:hypothetical protein